MGNTLYAAFADAGQAEKAAGALLDYGVRSEDISLVRQAPDGTAVTTEYASAPGSTYGTSSDPSIVGGTTAMTTSETTTTYGTDRDNDLKNAGDSALWGHGVSRQPDRRGQNSPPAQSRMRWAPRERPRTTGPPPSSATRTRT